MPIGVNGSGTITGISVGGLPDGIVDTDMLAANAVTAAKSNISGSIVNVSSYTKTNTASTSVAQGAYSEALISLSYAAASSSNKLLIIANFSISVDSAATVYATLHIGGSASGYRGDADGNRNRTSTSCRTGNSGGLETMSIVYLHSSPSTSSTAYDVRGSHANDATQTMYINRTHADTNNNYEARNASSITILEVAA